MEAYMELPLEELADGTKINEADPGDRVRAAITKFIARLQEVQGSGDGNAGPLLTQLAATHLCRFLLTMPVMPQVAAHVLMMVGAACEYGADATTVSAQFLPALERWVVETQAVFAPPPPAPAPAAEPEQPPGQAHGEEGAPAPAPPQEEEKEKEEVDEEAEARKAAFEPLLAPLGQATAAVLTRTLQGRQRAKTMEALYTASVALRWASRFLHMIVTTLDEEEVLVLHPEAGKGFLVRIGGVSSNWQLHMLASHFLREPLGGDWPPMSDELLACQLGTGALEVAGGMTGAFDMYGWTGVEAGAPPAMRAWVWGEGVPADILPCPCPGAGNRRVLLLRKPSYTRHMSSNRDFDALRAKFEVLRTLPADELNALLAAMAAVPAEEKQRVDAAWSEKVKVGS